MAICPNCIGKGEIQGPPGAQFIKHWKTCPSCDGTREVRGYWRKCNVCKGWGELGDFIPRLCENCNGQGIVPSRSEEAGRPRRGRSIHIHFD